MTPFKKTTQLFSFNFRYVYKIVLFNDLKKSPTHNSLSIRLSVFNSFHIINFIYFFAIKETNYFGFKIKESSNSNSLEIVNLNYLTFSIMKILDLRILVQINS